jgi:hypothetical protein
MPYSDLDNKRAANQRYAVKNKDQKNTVTRNNRASKQRFLDAVKSFPCLDCGYFWPPYVMHLDHLNADTKVDNVSKLLRSVSWAKLVTEIMKCDLVCANCHSERSHQRLNLPH